MQSRLSILVQQSALMSVADADDAKFTANNNISNERIGVILGNSMGEESSDDHTVRTHIPGLQNVTAGSTFASLSSEEQSHCFKTSSVQGEPPHHQ